jgi:hypothetical protein
MSNHGKGNDKGDKDDQGKQGFSSRWARRKQAVKAANESENNVTHAEGADITGTVEPVELDREQKLEQLNQLTDADMPEIESLDEEADFSNFMSKGVSEALRKRALKKLFHGASYNLRDGLDEYDDDYTFFEKLDPNTITSDMKHMIEVEAKKERLLLEEQALQEELERQEAQEMEMEMDEADDEEEVTLKDGDETLELSDAAIEQSETIQVDGGETEERDDLQPQTPSLNTKPKKPPTLH